MGRTHIEVEALVKTWSDGTWQLNLAQHLSSPPWKLSKSAIKLISERVREFIQMGNGGKARDWACLGLALTHGDIINSSQFVDCFRPSQYKNAPLSKLKWCTIRVARWCSESLTKCSKRMHSWANYIELVMRAASDEQKLLSAVRTDQLIIYVLMITEETFGGLLKSSEHSHIEDLGREEIAAAASFLLARYDTQLSLKTNVQTPKIKYEPDGRENAAEAIRAAHYFRRVLDFEAFVFRFGYEIEREGYVFRVFPPSPQFGMSVDLGYLSTGMQGAQRARAIIENDKRVSLVEFCRELESRVQGVTSIFETVGPKPSLRMQLPVSLAQWLSKEIFMSGQMFAEDEAELADICYELHVDISELLDMAIDCSSGLSMGDFYNMSRLLRLYSMLRLNELKRLRVESPDVYVNSILAGARYDDILKNICVHGISEEKASAFMRLITWTAGSKEFLDLQYTSILQIKDMAVSMSSTQMHSNVLRNVLVRSKRRPNDDGAADPLSCSILDALSSQGVPARGRVEYRYAGSQGELDVVAAIGSVMLILECKNTILPCSAFERRTFFDHLDKAAEQLDKVQRLWKDPGFRKYLGQVLGWPEAEQVEELCTAIVPSVRLLSGIDHKNHPVRHAREFANVIESGKGVVCFENERWYEIDLWGGDRFGDKVVKSYLAKVNSVYQPIWRSMVETSREYGGDRWRVVEPWYGLAYKTYEKELKEAGVLSPIDRREPV